ESAPQQIIAQLAALGIGKPPLADLDGVQPRPVVDVVAFIEIDDLLGRTRVKAAQPADALDELAIGLGEIGAPGGSPPAAPSGAGVTQAGEGPLGFLIGVGRNGGRIRLFVGEFTEAVLREQGQKRDRNQCNPSYLMETNSASHWGSLCFR